MERIDLHNYEAFLLDYSEGNLATEDLVLLKVFILEHPELEIDLNDFDLPYIPPEKESADFKDTLKRPETGVEDEELLNYLEGRLSSEERALFELKLKEDKVLANNLELYRRTILAVEPLIVVDFKAILQKTDDDLVLNNKLIAYVENQLTHSEKTEFEKELGSNPALQKELQIFSKTILVADQSLLYPDKEALKKENKVIVLFNLRSAGLMAAAILLLLGMAFIYRQYSSKEKIDSGLSKKNETRSDKQAPVNNPTVAAPGQEELPVNVDNVGTGEKKLARNDIKPGLQPSEQKDIPETTENVQPEIAHISEEEKTETPQTTEQTEIAVAVAKKENNVDSITNRQNFLTLSYDLDGEDDFSGTKRQNKKGGLWKRAVQVAKQANKMGVKSIDGQEDSENKYRLSFNSFSVGKK